MHKRGQITLFIILGIAIIVALVVSLPFVSKNAKEKVQPSVKKTMSGILEMSEVKDYVH